MELHFNILKFCLLISLLFIQNVDAQNSDQRKSSISTFNLLAPLNPQYPRIRMGYIKRINHRWMIGTDFGYGNKYLNFLDNDTSKKYKLWEIRSELYYLLNSKGVSKKYVSIELFYIKHHDVLSDGKYYNDPSSILIYDQADYQRKKYGFHIKYGLLLYSRKRWGLNVYTGLGLKIRSNTFSHIVNSRPEQSDPPDDDWFGLAQHKRLKGSRLGANFSLGMKLCYKM